MIHSNCPICGGIQLHGRFIKDGDDQQYFICCDQCGARITCDKEDVITIHDVDVWFNERKGDGQ